MAKEAAAAGVELIEGPVGMSIVAYVGDTPPEETPDGDAAAKSIMDALKGVAYHDDRQVVDLHIRVVRDIPGRCEVELWAITPENVGV